MCTLKPTSLLLEEGINILCEENAAVKNLLNGRIAALCDNLMRYVSEIELFNPVYRLVAVKDRNELVIRHILDSLAPLSLLLQVLKNKNIPQDAVLADIGSGAGMPGIPLALALPFYRWFLVERMDRRAGFLRNVSALLRLSNVSVEASPYEIIKHEQFSMITFRALTALNAEIAASMFKLLVPNGFIAAYKGKEEKAIDEAAKIGGNTYVERYSVPFLKNDSRTLLIAMP